MAAPTRSVTGNDLVSRADFPVVDEYVYLDTASIGLVPFPVQEAVRRFDEEIGSRGSIGLTDEAELEVFSGVRDAAAQLINAHPDDIALVENAAEALNQFAWWLRPGEGANVVSTDIDFPIVTYPWLRIAEENGLDVRLVATRDDPGALSFEKIEHLVDEETAVISISQIQFATGLQLDPKRLADLAHAHGALLALDATQAAGQVPIDVQASGTDFLITSGYKWLCGPFGATFCYITPELRQRFNPPFVGWRSTENPYDQDATQIPLAQTARRMEFSTPAYSAGVGVGRSMRYLSEVGIERIYQHNRDLAAKFTDGLAALGGQITTPNDPEARAGIVAARFAGTTPKDVANALRERQIIAAARFGAVRFAFHVFNTEEDVRVTLAALKDVLSGPRHE